MIYFFTNLQPILSEDTAAINISPTARQDREVLIIHLIEVVEWNPQSEDEKSSI